MKVSILDGKNSSYSAHAVNAAYKKILRNAETMRKNATLDRHDIVSIGNDIKAATTPDNSRQITPVNISSETQQSTYQYQFDTIQNNRIVNRAGLRVLAKGDNIEKVPVSKLSFESLVKQIRDTEREIESSNNSTSGSRGEQISLMSKLNETEMAFQQVVAISGKFVSAYQEIMRMPL